MKNIKANLKAYVALVGTTASALLGIYAADSVVGQVLLPISVIATAYGVWAATSVDADPEDAENPPA